MKQALICQDNEQVNTSQNHKVKHLTENEGNNIFIKTHKMILIYIFVSLYLNFSFCVLTCTFFKMTCLVYSPPGSHPFHVNPLTTSIPKWFVLWWTLEDALLGTATGMMGVFSSQGFIIALLREERKTKCFTNGHITYFTKLVWNNRTFITQWWQRNFQNESLLLLIIVSVINDMTFVDIFQTLNENLLGCGYMDWKEGNLYFPSNFLHNCQLKYLYIKTVIYAYFGGKIHIFATPT